tara:strand:- start:291 stop:815 length:525 start_codon:yes stop_codon:yes gene_type:complete
MAGQRLTDKSGLAQQPAKDDLLMVVDASDTTGSAQGTSKRIEAKNVIAVESVSLSNAQVLALHTTPVELIAAPGSGLGIMFHNILVDGIYVSSTETNRQALVFAYGNPSLSGGNTFGSLHRWMFGRTASNTNSIFMEPISGVYFDNQPLKVNSDGAFSADFTAVIHISYTIIKL